MRNKESEGKSFSNASVLTYSFLITHPIAIGFLSLILFSSCSIQKKISRSANLVVKDSSLQTAHIGISIYEPGTGKYWYNYQGDKYFVPASNTKIPTCYAAMKYLGDSLVGLRYGISEDRPNASNIIVIKPTGDPTFLHTDYTKQPVFDFLNQKFQVEKKKAGFYFDSINIERWGSGWTWSDYQEYYMAERNSFPVLGNVINIRLNELENRIISDINEPWKKRINLFKTGNKYFDSLVNNNQWQIKTIDNIGNPKIEISREISSNSFNVEKSNRPFSSAGIPFVTNDIGTVLNFLSDTLKTKFTFAIGTDDPHKYDWLYEDGDLMFINIDKWHTIHSQPTDSLLKPMMHRSDNFFAEQSLLMVSNERLGVMSDERIIDTLLKTDFKDLPQKPRWVDGCGLSRYNLFTPQDFVFILHKMQQEFGMDRVKNILATGGEGTLSNYYKADKGYIYAKTGSLSGVLCLSGFLYTKKNKLLIFSVLVNNYRSAPSDVRKAVEKFLESTRNNF